MDQVDAELRADAIANMRASDILPVEEHLMQLLKSADKTQSNANIRTMFRAIKDRRSTAVFFGIRYAKSILRKLNLVIGVRYALLAAAVLAALAVIFGMAGITWSVPVGLSIGWYLLNGPQAILNIRLGAILLYIGILRADGEILNFPAGGALD